MGKIEYIIAKELCCNTECDNKCEECKYGEIISEYEDDFDDECIGDECGQLSRLRTTAHSKM